jgi:hypothetical protein
MPISQLSQRSQIAAALVTAGALVACAGDKSEPSPAPVGERRLGMAFPSAELVDEGGHLAIPEDALPQAEGGTPFPVERLQWRRGFSVVQTTVFETDEPLDPASLPGLDGGGEPDSVQLWDLTTGTRLRCFAEVDAWPDNTEVPTLIVRPLEVMTVGHTVSVVVTSAARTTTGAELQPPLWFDAMLSGDLITGLEGRNEHYQDLSEALQSLGVNNIAVAVDFPIGEGATPTREIAATVSTPTTWAWRTVQDTDAGDTLPPGVWRRAEGRFTADNWLEGDVSFSLDAEGLPRLSEPAEVELYAYLPDAVREAEPGTVPVWLFGHGIFGEPDRYVNDEDSAALVELANRAGAIILATTWRGLTYKDTPTAIAVGDDFGRIPELTDKLSQGVGNTIALSRLALEGDLLDDDLFMGKADPSRLWYYGISLGGIEGAVMLANNDRIEHGVLHVGGSAWSTMLERSSNWPTFEALLTQGVPSPHDRQLLYAASQLFWDEADPASFVPELQGRSLLWQEAIHDDQVPNLTTELLARSVGMRLLDPSATTPDSLTASPAPLQGPALSQFDPEKAPQDGTNRPSPKTYAHDEPRHYEGTKAQTLRFLDPADPGVVEHFCGDAACSASNPG